MISGIVFAGSLDGHVRGYDSKDGKIIWDFNTAVHFETVNGIEGSGGSIDGPAPMISDGMLMVNSGYGMFGQMRGNVLLAFDIKKIKQLKQAHEKINVFMYRAFADRANTSANGG
ncbi:MAG: hypothetical protein WDM78_02105 [Puia sp.]